MKPSRARVAAVEAGLMGLVAAVRVEAGQAVVVAVTAEAGTGAAVAAAAAVAVDVRTRSVLQGTAAYQRERSPSLLAQHTEKKTALRYVNISRSESFVIAAGFECCPLILPSSMGERCVVESLNCPIL
jgi:hypothetical protein